MEDSTKQTVSNLHKLVNSYTMPEKAKNLIGSGNVIVLCGVTASGKNTIANYLVSHGNYRHVVSHTTRMPRANHGVEEQNGKEYWFVSPQELLEMVKNQEFVEVKAIHGETCYGTSIKAVESVFAEGRLPVLEIDVQGALEFINAVPNLRPYFILPPSFDVWMERLGSRGNLTDIEKARRLSSAKMEIETVLANNSFIFIVNHEVDATAEEITRGVDASLGSQAEYRKLAEELLENIRSI
ncbi:guanylate kinase [Candidatus Saccharibacteria bacterium]|nr:guanylate kinase [Candidatus Saccharibacteria bacterium]